MLDIAPSPLGYYSFSREEDVVDWRKARAVEV
jgi:hypothetical protein